MERFLQELVFSPVRKETKEFEILLHRVNYDSELGKIEHTCLFARNDSTLRFMLAFQWFLMEVLVLARRRNRIRF